MPAQPDWQRTAEPPGSGGSSRRWGSLRGGAGVGIVAGSAALGATATIAMRAQPGQVLGACIVLGAVIAALAVRPRSGRLIFPVPVLSYLIAALIAGIAYNRSSSKTELVIGAAQWVANGFFLMTLATVLAIMLITARWLLERRHGRATSPPGRPGPADVTSRRPQAGRARGVREDGSPPRGVRGNGSLPRGVRGDGSSRKENQEQWGDPGTRPPGPTERGDSRGGSGGMGPPGRNVPPPRGYPDQRPARRYGPDPGQSNGAHPGQSNGAYPGQPSGQRYGQDPGQPSGQRYAQDPGQPSGQRYGQDPGQLSGQWYGQDPDRRNGTYPDRGNGQDPGQPRGQRYGHYPGPRHGRSPG